MLDHDLFFITMSVVVGFLIRDIQVAATNVTTKQIPIQI